MDDENENGVTDNHPVPLDQTRSYKAAPYVLAAIVLVIVAVASIVKHWHMGG